MIFHFLKAKLLHFSDGTRRIDYVIAFKLPEPSIQGELLDCLLNLLQHGVDIEVTGLVITYLNFMFLNDMFQTK